MPAFVHAVGCSEDGFVFGTEVDPARGLDLLAVDNTGHLRWQTVGFDAAPVDGAIELTPGIVGGRLALQVWCPDATSSVSVLLDGKFHQLGEPLARDVQLPSIEDDIIVNNDGSALMLDRDTGEYSQIAQALSSDSSEC